MFTLAALKKKLCSWILWLYTSLLYHIMMLFPSRRYFTRKSFNRSTVTAFHWQWRLQILIDNLWVLLWRRQMVDTHTNTHTQRQRIFFFLMCSISEKQREGGMEDRIKQRKKCQNEEGRVQEWQTKSVRETKGANSGRKRDRKRTWRENEKTSKGGGRKVPSLLR